MEKLYERINFENAPSTKTPLNAENLNKMDKAINDLDDRCIELDGKIENVDSSITELNGRCDTLNERIDNIQVPSTPSVPLTETTVEVDLLDTVVLKNGYLVGQDGTVVLTASDSLVSKRVCTPYRMYSEEEVNITCKNGYNVCLFWYKNGNDSDTSAFIEGTVYYQTFKIEKGKYFRLAFKKTDESKVDHFGVRENAEVLTKSKEVNDFAYEFPLGDYRQGQTVAGGIINSSDTRLSGDTMCVPYDGVKFKVSMNPNYVLGIRSGPLPTDMPTNDYWYMNGDIITIPSGNKFFRVGTAIGFVDEVNNETYKISLSNVEDMNLKLFYQKEECKDFSDEQKILSECSTEFTSTFKNNKNKLAVISHISDVHGDAVRLRTFTDFTDKYCSFGCITGDILAYRPVDGISFATKMLKESSCLKLVCAGNHDVYDTAYTDAKAFTDIYSDLAEKFGYLSASGTAANKSWYYRDSASYKLRFISLNIFQLGGSERSFTHFTEEQLSWFVATLKSTPANYGVVLLYHSPLSEIASDENNKFYQTPRYNLNNHNAIVGDPIADIIDSFINRATLSRTYSQTGTPSSFSVSADFTSLNSGVEFIAHLTGHIHADSVGYVEGYTKKQLMLNITCGIAFYGTDSYPFFNEPSDIGRSLNDATQNAFNVYVIDRSTKTVKIIRAGANCTKSLKDRDKMIIPYSD